MRNGIDQGALFVLSGVPAADLRVLYKHAAVTVCPSLAEGFDYSGVESMCSGGITVASDIPVHREVYGDAAEYFERSSSDSLTSALKQVLYGPQAARVQAQLRVRGKEIAPRYAPITILPQWANFLKRVESERIL
jgi:glycosyltransferase involved in cell wall biosynthesis